MTTDEVASIPIAGRESYASRPAFLLALQGREDLPHILDREFRYSADAGRGNETCNRDSADSPIPLPEPIRSRWSGT